MSRFYFHVRDGDEFIEDSEGIDLPSLEAAHGEAVLAAREMIAERVLQGDVIDGQVFEIADEKGFVLESFPLKSVIRLQDFT